MYTRTPKRVSAALSAVALTAAGLAAATAPAQAGTPSAADVVCAGPIRAIDENGSPIGYLQFGGRYYNATTDIAQASTFRTKLGDRQLIEDTGASGSATPYFAPVSGVTGSELTEGSSAYTIMSRAAATDPGAPPQQVPHTSNWQSQGRVEAAVWHFDPVSHRLRPTWINDNNGSPSASKAGVFMYLSSYVFMIADLDTFNAQYGGARPGSLELVTSDPGCTQRPQSIAFTSTAPATAYVGERYTAQASSDSGLPVTLSSDTPQVCTVGQDGAVRFVGAGQCTVLANQAGDLDFQPAERTTQTSLVARIAPTISVSAPNDIVSGQGVRLSASVGVPAGAPGGAPAGTVQFAVDGEALGGPVAVDGDQATSSTFTRGAGDHDLTASFVPTDPTTYAPADATGTLGVARAATSTVVAVTPKQLTAHVSPTAPGVGTATGPVVFRVAGQIVGKADLVGGTALLDHVVEPGEARKVSAEYLGDDDMTGSASSLTRRDPAITSAVSSSAPRSAEGWYSSPVRIAYRCNPDGAGLTTDCPADDAAGEGAAQIFTRSVSAADGGIGTVSTTVDIDQTAPTVTVKGVKAGQRYFAKAPSASCVGSDSLSGLRSCKVTTSRGRGGLETATAEATDKAGNRARTSTTYRVVRYAVAGADYVNGAYVIHRGIGINVQAQTRSRPTYRLASATPARLRTADTRRMLKTGKDTWVYGAAVNMPRTKSGIWYLGIQEGRSFTPIKVRMIG